MGRGPPRAQPNPAHTRLRLPLPHRAMTFFIVHTSYTKTQHRYSLIASMATLTTLCFSLSIALYLFHLTIVSSFSPIDNYLIDCGFQSKTRHFDNRLFIGDSSGSGSVSRYFSEFFTTTRTVSLRDPVPPPHLSPLYYTARIFKKPSKYMFDIGDRGTHLVRLHFRRFDFSDFDFNHAQFHVSANGFLLLNNFTIENTHDCIIKDYMIWVDGDKLEIVFTPVEPSKIAFVNAIEVISAPKDMIADVAQFVSSEKTEQVNGLMKNSLETVYRVNVGGPKVTPFNDSLWRTWVPDNGFLKSTQGSKQFHFSGQIKYLKGGASREVAPDNVYNTARFIKSSTDSIPKLNMTWEFPVEGNGYMYLVRMHFCDIASISLGLLYFNVYVNGNLAYENLDLSSVSNGMLASPFYADFVVDRVSSGVLTVSVGPSNESMSHTVDAILNGVEIMKMNNSMGSLDGKLSAESVLRSCPRENSGVLVPLIAAVCLLLIASVIIQKGRLGRRGTVAWSQLPTSVSEIDLKHNNQVSSGKL